MIRPEVDVVVVGAGFAGLASASAIVDAGSSVQVLEASSRVGGRTDTETRGSLWLEAGGQWTGPGQSRVRALAERFGVDMFDTPTEGTDLQLIGGSITENLREPTYTDAIRALDELAASIPGAEPWTASEADTLDAQPTAQWLDRNVDDDATRSATTRVLEGLMTTSASEMSVLTVLHAAKTSGTLAAALGIEGGAQEQRLIGGLHGLAQQLADRLGESVHLSSPVRAIGQRRDGVEVTCEDAVVRAKRCVVAVPPSGWAGIAFDPALPSEHAALPQLMPLGSVIKVQLVYDHPFWRDRGYSGLVIDEDGPFSFMADNTSPDGDQGVLVTFLSAKEADAWGDRSLGPRAPSRRRQAFAQHVRTAFGDNTPDPVDYVDRDWRAVPWVGGGYSGVMRPGGWMRVGSAFREPVGCIHWASAESAHEWNGYVEGALDAGARAAHEVLSEL